MMPTDANDAMLKKAMERRDAALREAAAWEDWIGRYRELDEDGRFGDDISRVRKSAPGVPANKQSPEVAETLRVASSYLEIANRPVPIGEMLEALERRGVVVGGKTPSATLDSRLRYSQMFVAITGRGWWFKDRPVPESHGSVTTTTIEVATQETLPAAP